MVRKLPGGRCRGAVESLTGPEQFVGTLLDQNKGSEEKDTKSEQDSSGRIAIGFVARGQRESTHEQRWSDVWASHNSLLLDAAYLSYLRSISAAPIQA